MSQTLDYQELISNTAFQWENEVADCESMPEMFENHPGQKKAWESEFRIIAIFAGWRSGKSVIGSPWLIREIQRCGEGDYAIIAPSHPLLQNMPIPNFKLIAGEWFYHMKSENVFLLTDEGSIAMFGRPGVKVRVLLRHGDNPEAIEAFTAKAIWVDEPGNIKDETWEAIESRVSTTGGRILLTSRPYRHNWYVTKVWNRVMVITKDKEVKRKPNADPEIDVINFKSTDNPVFPKAEYEKFKLKMPAWRHRMKYDGIPEKPAGAVYDCFDTELNICPRFKIPRIWPRYFGLDFGPIHTACIMIAQELDINREPTGVYYAYRDYKTDMKRDTAINVQMILHGEWDAGTRYARGGNNTEDGWRGDFRAHGLPVGKPMILEVESGIAKVYELFATGRLKIFDDLEETIDEINSYGRKVDEEGETLEEIDKKSRYHLMDALRYIAPNLRQGENRFETERNKNHSAYAVA